MPLRSTSTTTRLLVMACSGTKRVGHAPMRAFDRYDGVMWRTLRTALTELPAPVRSSINVWFLSARYGFHPADLLITHYEQSMTPQRAADLLQMPTSNHHAFRDAVKKSGAVCLAGGLLYRETMKRALGHHPYITETNGRGIGIHRQQLRHWLHLPQH